MSSTDENAGRRVTGNVLAMTSAKLLGDVAAFLMFVVLSKTFGDEGIGQYSIGMALGGLFAVFADFGLYFQSIQVMSRRPDDASRILRQTFAIRLALSVITVAALGVAVLAIPASSETRMAIAILAFYQVAYTTVHGLTAAFVSSERMFWAALVDFAFKVLSSGGVIALALAGVDLVPTLAWFPAATVCVLVALPRLLRRNGFEFDLQLSLTGAKSRLRESFPYAQSELLRYLSSRFDVLALGALLGAAAAGIYNVGYRVVLLLLFVPYFGSLALLPLVSRLHEQRGDVSALYSRAAASVVLVAVPAAVGLWLLAPQLISVVFGDAFGGSVFVLRLLAPVLFLAFVSNLSGAFLTGCGKQTVRTRIQWIAAATNVAANLALIPSIGVPGAAVATLLAEAVLVGLGQRELSRLFKPKLPWLRLLLSGAAAATFVLATAYWPQSSLVATVMLCAGIYCAVVLLSRDVRRNECRSLLGALRQAIH